jgi:hypothetical protein
VVLVAEIELGERDLLAQDVEPTRVDVVPIVENTLLYQPPENLTPGGACGMP